MAKEILIHVGEGERRVAILEDNKLDDFYIELDRYQSLLGNVYKGRVESILPSINGAFVNIGQDRNGFLYLTDAEHPLLQELDEVETIPGTGGGPRKLIEKIFHKDKGKDHVEQRQDAKSEGQAPDGGKSEGGVPEGKPEGGKPEGGRREGGRNQSGRQEGKRKREEKQLSLKEGQEVLVQVVKDPFGTKGARLTTHISLAGRFVVYMPMDNHSGISKKIESGEERQRLREILKECGFAKTGGFIIRTAAMGQGQREIIRDAKYLVTMWEEIRKASKKKQAPALIFKEHSLLSKVARDFLTENVTALVIDSQEEYQRLNKFVTTLIGPEMATKIQFYGKTDVHIFEAKNVSDELDKIYEPKVYLKSGAYVVIEPTEGLTVVDVNSGRFKSRGTPEEAAFQVNLEAAPEIARQLRLRDLGGIIVIDFIDMNREDHKRKVIHALREALSRDHSKTEVNRISPLGLVEMTRARTGKTIESLKFERCPYCDGRGRIKID